MNGFPLIQELNVVRHNMFREYTNANNEIVERVLCWIGHKTISVCVLPLNFAGVGVGLVGMNVACGLSAFKVAVFAVTLGHVKPSFDTKTVYFLMGTLVSLAEIGEIATEVAEDTVELIEIGITTPYHVVKWIVEELRMTNILNPIIQKITQALDSGFSSIEDGFFKASLTEIDYDYDGDKFPFYIIDKPAKDSEENIGSSNRSWKQILDHTSACMVSIPVNGAIAGATLMGSFICVGFFFTKGIFNIVTNSSLPVPSFAGQVLRIYEHSVDRFFADMTGCVTDIFTSIYKISETCGVNRFADSAVEILEYIPEALFEEV